MRKVSFGMALALAIVGSSWAAWAQTNNTPDTKKTQKAPAATTFNPRDLSGIWMDDHARPNKVVERYWIYEFTPDEPPMTDWGKAQFAKAKSGFGEHPSPIT
jgi:hypothetical protein